MTKSLLLPILLFSLASLASEQTVSLQGTGNDAGLQFNSNGAGGFLSVFNGTDDAGNPITLLDFFVSTPNPDGTMTIRGGFGAIPSNAFTSLGTTNRMNLAVDTSQVAAFSSICITSNSGSTCSPSQGGPIQVVWKTNNNDDFTDGPFTQHVQGRGVFNSINTQGSILGFSFSNTGADINNAIGFNHSHTITITKN